MPLRVKVVQLPHRSAPLRAGSKQNRLGRGTPMTVARATRLDNAFAFIEGTRQTGLNRPPAVELSPTVNVLIAPSQQRASA